MLLISDRARHAAATAAAILGFLALYFGLALTLWAALLLAAGIYAGLLLLIRPKPGTEEISRDPEADLREAHAQMRAAASRLRRSASGAARPEDQALVGDLAGKLEELDRILSEDPAHLRGLRRFAKVFLPRMAENVEAYLRLSRSSDPKLAPRISALREQLAGYPAAVGGLTRAALSQDLSALESEVEVLSFQMTRGGVS